MPISLTCGCGKALKVRDELLGKRIKCPACSTVVVVPGALPPAAPAKTAPPKATLRVKFDGTYMLFDVAVEVFLDGKKIGQGHIKKGVSIRTETKLGTHFLEVRFFGKARHYTVHLLSAGTYTAYLAYSKMIGNFTEELDLEAPKGAAPLPRRSAAQTGEGDPATGARRAEMPSPLDDDPNASVCFSCRTAYRGALGLVEHATAAEFAVGTWRKALVKFEAGELSLHVEDANGQLHEQARHERDEITEVTKAQVGRSQQVGLLLMRSLGWGGGFAFLIIVGIVFAMGPGRLANDIQRNPGILLVFVAVVAFALVVAFLCVFVPGLFRTKGDLVCLTVHTDRPALAIVVDAKELAQATQIFRWTKIPMQKAASREIEAPNGRR